MSHLAPTKSVQISPGGSAISGTRGTWGSNLPPVEDWDQRVTAYADSLELEPDARDGFTARLDETVEALALVAGIDLEVARTKVVGAIAGAHGMVTDTIPIHLDQASIDDALATWEITDPTETDTVMARLSLLHLQLVDGQAPGLPEDVEVHVGQVAYTLDSVPTTAKDVVAWIGEADSDDDRRARAQAALEVENERGDDQRATVTTAIGAVLSDGG